MFLSTQEALITIFPQASKENIKKYNEQLYKVKILDPALIISPNQNWINQHTHIAYQQVMDAFATNDLPQNKRRDENSLCIFHFSSLKELYTVRKNIHKNYPNAFYAQPQQEPIGTAWILLNMAVGRSDFGKDDRFFAKA